MEIYLLRHGIAVEQDAWGPRPDAERPLTEEGADKLAKAVRGMRRMELSFDAIVSSPYVRAQETAAIVAEGLGSGKIELSDAMKPEAEFAEFEALVRRCETKKRVLFVGHMPSVGEFLCRLIGGPRGGSVDFKKGAMAKVEAGASASGSVSGELKWFLTQRQMREMA